MFEPDSDGDTPEGPHTFPRFSSYLAGFFQVLPQKATRPPQILITVILPFGLAPFLCPRLSC